MTTLRFSDELPPGARVMGTQDSPRGIDREEVRRSLRGNPGKWTLVYGDDEHPEGATLATAHSWKREKGFEVATQVIEDSKVDDDDENVNRSKWRYKIWIQYTGEAVTENAPESPASPEPAVAVPAAPSLPTPPPPAAPVTGERPKSAFQVEWENQQGQPAPVTFE